MDVQQQVSICVLLTLLSVSICIIVLFKVWNNPKTLESDEIRCKKLFICAGDPFSSSVTSVQPRLAAYTSTEGNPVIALFKDDQIPRLMLEINESNCPRVVFADGLGKYRLELTLDDNDTAHLMTYDSTDSTPLQIQAGDEGAAVVLNGEDRRISLLCSRSDPTLSPCVTVVNGEEIASLQS
ncbi:hypothetical protein RCL1_004652 [Eukaryota sp. TZLM3-RCL]